MLESLYLLLVCGDFVLESRYLSFKLLDSVVPIANQLIGLFDLLEAFLEILIQLLGFGFDSEVAQFKLLTALLELSKTLSILDIEVLISLPRVPYWQPDCSIPDQFV